jgi:hypothetical protein
MFNNKFSCAVSHSNPLGDAQRLYSRLLATSVLTTNGISSQYTIEQENGDVIELVTQNTGYVHIAEQEFGWRIFVPRSEHDKEVCYALELLGALTKLFGITQSPRESIGHVLNSNLLLVMA